MARRNTPVRRASERTMQHTMPNLAKRPVPDSYVAGLLRIDPEERCDPRFAELNAKIATEPRATTPPPSPAQRKAVLEERAAEMRAKYSLHQIRKKAALDGWKTRRTKCLRDTGRTN